MILSQILGLGYELKLLPFNSIECVKGETEIYRLRLKEIKRVIKDD